MNDVRTPDVEILPPVHLKKDEQETMARVMRLATLLDAQFGLPGTGVRIGIDGIIGLLPFVGDAASLLLALYVFSEARRAKCRKRTIVRMAINTGIDTAIGAVPVLGDLFDIGFKSNLRNARLILEDIERRHR